MLDISIQCIATKRAVDSCYACDKVEKCNLPEAIKGRVELAKVNIKRRDKMIKELKVSNLQDISYIRRNQWETN